MCRRYFTSFSVSYFDYGSQIKGRKGLCHDDWQRHFVDNMGIEDSPEGQRGHRVICYSLRHSFRI